MGFSGDINGSAADCKLLMEEADARMSQHLGGGTTALVVLWLISPQGIIQMLKKYYILWIMFIYICE